MDEPTPQTEAIAAFSRHWRPLVATFSGSLRHVQQCQLIQFGTCTRADCQATVDHIQHYGFCRTRHKQGRGSRSKKCETCEFLLSVLIQHSLDCSSHQTCFVPNCSWLKALTHRVQDPAQLASLLLRALSAAEIRTVVWCLGGGSPQELFLSTGQDHVKWGHRKPVQLVKK